MHYERGARIEMLRRAYTIVELLVVTSIILLLLSLLVPVIASARRQARITSSVGNLRQLHSSCLLYVEDFGATPGLIVDLPPDGLSVKNALHLPTQLFHTGGTGLDPENRSSDVYRWYFSTLRTPNQLEAWRDFVLRSNSDPVIISDDTQSEVNEGDAEGLYEPRLSIGVRYNGSIERRRRTGMLGSYDFWL